MRLGTGRREFGKLREGLAVIAEERDAIRRIVVVHARHVQIGQRSVARAAHVHDRHRVGAERRAGNSNRIAGHARARRVEQRDLIRVGRNQGQRIALRIPQPAHGHAGRVLQSTRSPVRRAEEIFRDPVAETHATGGFIDDGDIQLFVAVEVTGGEELFFGFINEPGLCEGSAENSHDAEERQTIIRRK